MKDPRQLAIQIQAPTDQVAAAVRDHEQEAHGGKPCDATRSAALAILAHGIGVSFQDMRVFHDCVVYLRELEAGGDIVNDPTKPPLDGRDIPPVVDPLRDTVDCILEVGDFVCTLAAALRLKGGRSSTASAENLLRECNELRDEINAAGFRVFGNRDGWGGSTKDFRTPLEAIRAVLGVVTKHINAALETK